MTQPSTEQQTSRRVALVTGANKGIGYEIAVGLGVQGFLVGVGARDDGRRDAAVRSLQTDGIEAFGVPLDVISDVSVRAAAQLIEARVGHLDALVNNAGISGEMGSGWMQDPTELDLDEVRRVLDTNVFGVVRSPTPCCPYCVAPRPRGSSMSPAPSAPSPGRPTPTST